MLRFKLFIDKDKETQWLNEMVDRGWAMTGFFMGVYRFEPCEKGRYRYQVDLCDKVFSLSPGYRDLMEELGIEIVQRWGAWVILRKETDEDSFELYTDVESKIENAQKIQNIFKAGTLLEAICFGIELLSARLTGSELFVAFAIMLLLLMAVFANQAFQTGEMIRRLKEQSTGIQDPGKKTCPPMLFIGLLLNSMTLLLRSTISEWLSIVMALMAIVLIFGSLFVYGKSKY